MISLIRRTCRRENRSYHRAWNLLKGMGLLLCLYLALGNPLVLASVHQYVEGPDRVMVRSLQTLRDRADRAWQVVLFNRLKNGQIESVHLRLVGFPGVVALTHPQPLIITTGTEKILRAVDLLPESMAPSVGEYDLRAVMTQLNSNTPLRLTVPITNQAVELIVPPFVVQEWRQVADRRS